ncbi:MULTISPECIES: hypothetical protein [unclassified Ruegeria]|uniref:hypothetical protein n=1 Tax=unclassified Ruegeria TaxID=2625375 RepID=UPI001AEA3920|nr:MULTISPECIES: hypothetical protein [unclassified Ruegeria]
MELKLPTQSGRAVTQAIIGHAIVREINDVWQSQTYDCAELSPRPAASCHWRKRGELTLCPATQSFNKIGRMTGSSPKKSFVRQLKAASRRSSVLKPRQKNWII